MYRAIIAIAILVANAASAAIAADKFRDCQECPEMIAVPAGTFTMGSGQAETDALGLPQTLADRERPQHRVNVPAFAAGVYEVTLAEFRAFAAATGHPETGNCLSRDASGTRANVPTATWRTPGFKQTDREPVVCVGWSDVNAYVAWLSQRTGKTYRLLSEAEWEYAARAGTQTAWFWGDTRTDACRYANVPNVDANTPPESAGSSFACADGFTDTAPVGSFQPNAFGLHDMIGNVWEWVADCLHPTYVGAPVDGSAWVDDPECRVHVVRGGGSVASQGLPRSAGRSSDPLTYRGMGLGFRVARAL